MGECRWCGEAAEHEVSLPDPVRCCEEHGPQARVFVLALVAAAFGHGDVETVVTNLDPKEN